MRESQSGQIVPSQDYYPRAERALLLRKCTKCRKPFKGHFFAQVCDRPECQEEKPKPSFSRKGNRYGTLVVRQLARATQHCSYWRCKCDCGRVVIKPDAYLDSKSPDCGKDCVAG